MDTGTDFLVFNYPITTQECMLSVNCETISSKDSKNASSTPKSQSSECFLSVECDKSPPSNNSSYFKTLLQLQIRNQMNLLRQ